MRIHSAMLALWLAFLVLSGCIAQESAGRNIMPQAIAMQVCPTQPAVVCVPVTVTPGIAPSPTPTQGSIITPSATATASPTALSTALPITPIPAPIQCGFPGADSSGKGRQYTYTDPQFSGLRQNVRSGPATGYSVVAYIQKGSTVPVYWHVKAGGYDWYSLDPSCSQWAAMLGVLTDIP